MEGNDKEEFE